MWLSTSDYYEDGRRYSIQELGALIYPLDTLIDMVRSLTPAGAFEQPILRRMETTEAIFAIYQLFHALLEDTPIPEEGHPGYQEALVDEILSHMHACIELELEVAGSVDESDESRRIAWETFLKHIPECDDEGRPFQEAWLESHGVAPDAPTPFLSPALDSNSWRDLIEIIAGEFLADRDWELEALLDRSLDDTAHLREMMGLDLDRVHRLPHTPSPEELARATEYLNALNDAFSATLEENVD